ncbi:hypothetical protein PLICBS_007342 [Purpureocillium lilacinum]|uniref:uncharacterized protein n=1 Tax=Purpureocillium lilacinum TaxID=33203 RepID=UPI002082D8D2|nr:hypothetical protein PLICBS_007342 [Purpureocillium lilacinum]
MYLMRPIHAIVVAALSLAATAVEDNKATGNDTQGWAADCDALSSRCQTTSVADGNHDNGKDKRLHVMNYLRKLIQSDLPPGRLYGNGRHIACYQHANGPHGFCLFFENFPHGTNHSIGDIMHAFDAMSDPHNAYARACHGRCGRGWNKAWKHGYLKLDYVTKSCNGVCKY